jgi:hypothetical protein
VTAVKVYSRKSWLRYLAGLGVIVAGGNLLVHGLAPRSSPYHLWLGIIGLGVGGLDFIFRYCTPAMKLSAGHMTWYPALLRPKREIAYASVKSWRAEGRKLFFVTHNGHSQQVDLFELSESDRTDLRGRLTEVLGPPEGSAV